MSIKKYFDVASNIKSLAGTTAQKISSQVESVGFHEQEIIKEERYIPQADYSVPQGFARYGNAKDYYTQAIQRIYNTFPYDGSLKERLEWENESTYLDLYIYNDRYPRTNGYINFAAGGWGTPTALTANGYGIPASSANYEYIYVKGGPNQNPNGATPYRAQFTGSNYYEPSKNRGSNFALNVNSRGVSLEFWLKKKAFSDAKTQKEVIFDLWNGVTSSATNYARLRLELTSATGRRDGLAVGESPFLLTLYSGSTGFFQQRLATTTITTTGSVADSLWHHYAVTLKQNSSVTTRFYIDGRLNLEQQVSASGKGTLQDISGLDLRANIGALITEPSRRSSKPTTAGAYAGKLSASLDEFRFWKTERTGQEIGRFWFTQVGGGVNTDPEPFIETEVSANLDLGVYFKFNEGITNTASVDSTVLDYSGRFSNGAWTCPAITAGNFSLARSTESAIVLSNAAIKEYKDPIIYPQHASVKALTTVLEATGSSYDVNNNASIYNTLPSWIIEEDNDGDGDLRKLTQIISSYFDTLHLQIKDLNTIKDVGYVSGSNKPLPFAERLLNSAGLVAPEIFLDSDVLNMLANRSEDKVFEKPLEEVKNIIYKNIYNNLVYIFKSKGTEKSFRNLIRCFGIDDELVKLNMYANNVQFELRNNRRNVAVADRFVNFNTGDNKSGVVYNYRDPSNNQSAGYLSASAALADGHAITLETEILFPLKSKPSNDVYVDTNTISSSLFGVHGVQAVHAASSPSHTTWASNDIVNFQVYAVRDEAQSDNVRFVVTSSSPRGKVPYLTSELYEDVYNNTRWNLALRIKPEKYPLTSLVQGAELDPSRTTGSYTVELHGVQGDSGEILQQFTVSKTINGTPLHFITGSRRVYVGAHRTNFTGSLLSYSDVKVNACRFWLDYVENETLAGHILDTQNFGTIHPHWFAYPFNPSSSYGDIQKADTLVFNWEFLTNTGSAATGRFSVPDLTSGSLIASTNSLTASYGALGKIINPQYTARGDLFATSSTTVIDKDFVISSKLNLPENLKSEEMIQVLSATDQDVFTSDSRPTNYSFAFEKSMYQVISEEMINYFATLSDFHNLIGDPVNQWRPEYKSIDFMRQKFFETVENKELDFDKFYKFYKWFDSSLSIMLEQLAPVSADIAPDVRTVIENHILERSKYQRKFPFLAKSDTNYPTGRVDGAMAADKTAQASPDEFPAGTSFFTNTAFTRRQIGSSNTPQARPWKHFHAPLSKVVENLSPGKSLLFDGTDEYLNIGAASTWDPLIGGAGAAAKDFSISFWWRPEGTADNGRIMKFGLSPAHARTISVSSATTYPSTLFMYSSGAPALNVATSTSFSAGTWYHVVMTWETLGASSQEITWYVNGAQDVQSTGANTPSSIASGDCTISTATAFYPLSAGMCDFAIWDKTLTSDNVTEIYGGGTRVKLTTTSCKSNLLSWWMMGNGGGDSATGTIFDQKSTRNATPVNMETADIEEDSPAFKIPYGYIMGTPVNENMYWHRYMELSALTGSKLTNRSKLYQSISQSFYRRTNSPVKFGVEGTTVVAGVGKHHNAVVNYVFSAARAWGNLGPRVTGKGRPVLNKLVSSGSSVEQLISTTDVYYPSLKQRLGFGLSSSNGVAVSGPRHAPFSLYSSSVTTGYNAQVVKNYASGVMVTNLHNDFVIDTDIPMQGPFTEKYVGGRFYRHTALNKGTDTNQTRGEGFRIEFDNHMGTRPDNVLGVAKKSLVILPPNSRTGSSDPNMLASASVNPVHWPTAYRFRDVAAKRPVNIKNIQMRTGSTVIGNYEKNYQVVNSNSRMKNDPFFNDQSFKFALYPETLATRGRFPLTLQRTPTNTTSDYELKRSVVLKSRPVNNECGFLIDDAPNPGDAKSIEAKSYTLSIWVSASKELLQQRGPKWLAGEKRTLFSWGGLNGSVQDSPRRIFFESGSGGTGSLQGRPRLGIEIQRGAATAAENTFWRSADDLLATPGWYHIAFGGNHLGSQATAPVTDFFAADHNVYVNGVAHSASYYRSGQGAAAVSGTAGYDPAARGDAWLYLPIAGGTFDESQSFGPDGALASVAFWCQTNGNNFHGNLIPSASFRDVIYKRVPITSSYLDIALKGCPPILEPSVIDLAGAANLTGSVVTAAQAAAGSDAILYLWIKPTQALTTGYGRPWRDFSDVGHEVGTRLTQRATGSVEDLYSFTPLNASASTATSPQISPRSGTKTYTYYRDDTTANCDGNLDYTLPDRTGTGSNQSIIVNRFAGSGYEVMSLGYMDPAHEELSVYNALPYHNLAVRNHGLSGNVSSDPVAAKTITVIDQINKNRGLDQRASLHCGPFGSDSAFGSVPELTYVTTPSWGKTNRNARHRVKEVMSSAGVFDGADTLVDIGAAATWDALIGGSAASAKPFTVSAWVYPKSAGEGTVGKILSFADTDRMLFWTTNFVRIYMNGSVTTGDVQSSTLSFNKWYNITATYTGGTTGILTLYINGSKDHGGSDTQPSAPLAISGVNCTIGNTAGATGTWDGYIQNCAVWNRALAAGEVLSLYNHGKVATLVDESLYGSPNLTKGLLAWYRFNTNSGDSTTALLNHVANRPININTAGTGSSLTFATHKGPTTVAAGTAYDNLYIQHQIPQSPEQYSWISSSINPGERIYGFPPPGVLSGTVLSQLVTGSDFPYYGAGFKNNFAKFSDGTMVTPSVDIQSRTSKPHYGTYSGVFVRPGTWDQGTRVRLGQGPVAWDPIIGQSGATALAFTISCWARLNGALGSIYILFAAGSAGSAGLRSLNVTATGALTFFIEGSSADGSLSTPSDTISPSAENGTEGWYHIAATYGGGTAGKMRIYVDGKLQTTTGTSVSAPYALTAADFYGVNIGAFGGSLNGWDGNITDFAIWGSVSGSGGELSPSQINKLYNNGSPININDKFSDNIVAWYRFNPWFGDRTSDIPPGLPPGISNGNIRNVLTGSGLGSGIDTQGRAFALALRPFSPFHVEDFNTYLNNQNGPYGWPTWKQIRVGETPVARALRKQNYIGQVVPPAPVPLLIRNEHGSMVQVGTVPGKSSNTAVLYYEGPIDSKMGPVDFFFEDNTEDSDVANNMRVQLPYGNSLEYFSNDGLNNRLGLSINLDKPMVYDTVRDFLVASSLSTVVRYTESMYPSAHNMYRARVRGRPSYSIDKIWNKDRAKRSTLGGLTGSFGQTEGKLYVTQTGSNSSVWPLDAHNNFTTTSSVVPWDGAGQLMNSYSRYSGSSRITGLSGTLTSLGLQTASPTYAVRVPTGRTAGYGYAQPILAGDVKWTAATEAGKDPYQNYSTWGERASTAMKDGSIIPEFRISQHLRSYYDTHAGNFLTDNITGIYEISGATIPNSSINGFFKTYSNSDFMKYFRVIDDSLNDQRSGDLKIERDRIKISARGLIKFLPYRGFYPAERTAEIATIFSQSYGSSILKGAKVQVGSGGPSTAGSNTNQLFRIFAEPMMAPGILFNTVKSGLAVGSTVLTNTASYWVMQPPSEPMTGMGVNNQTQGSAIYGYPEGALYYERLMTLGTGSASGNGAAGAPSSGKTGEGWHIAKVPFEAIQDPATFFNAQNLLNIGSRNKMNQGDTGAIIGVAGYKMVPLGAIYDTAIPNTPAALPGAHGHESVNRGASLPSIQFNVGPFIRSSRQDFQPLVILTDPEGGYRYAIDNFLCETTNFFMNGITSLRSNREEQFQTVQSGNVYSTTFKLFRSKRAATDDSRWDMYSRASSFGFPLGTQLSGAAVIAGDAALGNPVMPTFSHHLPPYYSGEATAKLIYTASYTGQPTVDEILSNLKISYYREETVPNYSASVAAPNPGISPLVSPTDKTAGRYNDPRMQVDSSFNLKEKIQEVPEGTTAQANYWLIQSKFETPILNFANVTQSSPPGPRRGGASKGSNLITDEWVPSSPHTFTGDVKQTSAANLTIRGMWHQYGSPITASTAGVFAQLTDDDANANSLADVVGFQKGITVRVGDPKKNAILEEAVVVVPFMVSGDQRQFFSYTGTARDTTNYANVETAMKKYIFPPKFDFVRTSANLAVAREALEGVASGGTIGASTDKRLRALQNALTKAANEASLVQPVLMYVFEFGVEIDEKDIADMWQNLPPSIDEKMQSSTEVIIEDRELLRVMAANNEDIQWMVFKVKKRAKRDFDIYKRSLVTTDTSALAPKLRGPYTYNWPYDYFSLVELVTIDATVQWTSGDMQYELEHDEALVLDGRPPLRGTAGARVIPSPTILFPGIRMDLEAPQASYQGAAILPPGPKPTAPGPKPTGPSKVSQVEGARSTRRTKNRRKRGRRGRGGRGGSGGRGGNGGS